MRTLELTAHVKAISRKQGRSATAAAAYRACAAITCEREGRVHDYSRKQGLEVSVIVVPEAAPSWALDRARLWNAAELRERNGARGPHAGAWKANATTAREVMFGLPAELSPAGRLALAHRVARHLVEVHGVAVDFSIHAPGQLGDQRNHHCHMMFTTRRITAAGLADKTREWDARFTGSRTVRDLRATLAAIMNAALAEEGHGAAVRVEHRSLKDRGIARPATTHQPLAKVNGARKRKARERQAWERQQRNAQTDRHQRERAELAREQETRAATRKRDIDQREARAIEEARTRQSPAPASPPPPGRLQRIFRAATGRADHAPEPPPPAREQERSSGDLRATFQAERDRMAEGHGRDARSLDERHRAEDQQLDRATAARADRDRVEEVQERRALAEARAHDRTHDQERHRDDRDHDRPRHL